MSANEDEFGEAIDDVIAVVMKAQEAVIDHDFSELLEQIRRESNTGWFLQAPHAYLEGERRTKALKKAVELVQQLANLLDDDAFRAMAGGRMMKVSNDLIEKATNG